MDTHTNSWSFQRPYLVIVQRSKNIPEYRLGAMDNSLQCQVELNLCKSDFFSLHGNIMISIRRKFLFSDNITIFYYTFTLNGPFRPSEWLTFMIYKVVFRRESLRHSIQKINCFYSLFLWHIWEYCYTTETEPVLQSCNPQQSSILSQEKRNLSVKFKTTDSLR